MPGLSAKRARLGRLVLKNTRLPRLLTNAGREFWFNKLFTTNTWGEWTSNDKSMHTSTAVRGICPLQLFIVFELKNNHSKLMFSKWLNSAYSKEHEPRLLIFNFLFGIERQLYFDFTINRSFQYFGLPLWIYAFPVSALYTAVHENSFLNLPNHSPPSSPSSRTSLKNYHVHHNSVVLAGEGTDCK